MIGAEKESLLCSTTIRGVMDAVGMTSIWLVFVMLSV